MKFCFGKILCVTCFVFLMLLSGCIDEKDDGLQYEFSIRSTNDSEDNKEELQTEYYEDNNVFYVTPYGEKYHTADCFYIKRDLSECKEFSDIKAEERGYAPCSRCIG